MPPKGNCCSFWKSLKGFLLTLENLTAHFCQKIVVDASHKQILDENTSIKSQKKIFPTENFEKLWPTIFSLDRRKLKLPTEPEIFNQSKVRFQRRWRRRYLRPKPRERVAHKNWTFSKFLCFHHFHI